MPFDMGKWGLLKSSTPDDHISVGALHLSCQFDLEGHSNRGAAMLIYLHKQAATPTKVRAAIEVCGAVRHY